MVKKFLQTYFGEKKFLQIVTLKKRDSNSEEIAQVPPLQLNGPSPMRMEAHDLAKQEIDLIHCQSNDSRPTYREQYTINDTFANRRKLRLLKFQSAIFTFSS